MQSLTNINTQYFQNLFHQEYGLDLCLVQSLHHCFNAVAFSFVLCLRMNDKIMLY